MDTDLILKNVSKHIELNEKEKKLFMSLLEPKTFKRKDIYLNAGEDAKLPLLLLMAP